VGEVKYRPKTKMRVYQARALKKYVANGGVLALHMPMRSGKTKTAIDCKSVMRIFYGRPKRVLVVCPLSVIDVWVNELRKHSPVAWRAETRYGITEGDGLFPEDPMVWRIINYEALYSRQRVGTPDGYSYMMVPNQALYQFKPQGMIADESTALGDPTTKQSIFAFKLVQDLDIQYRIIMTGTPWHRRILKSFGAFKFLDYRIFGTNWGLFKKTYGLWGGPHDTKLLMYSNLDQFREKVKPVAFTMKHVPPMKPIHQVIPVPFTEGVDEYQQMADEAYIEVKNHEIDATLVLTRILKLAQIANGYARTSEVVVSLGSDKRRFAEGFFRDLLDQDCSKVVVVCEEVPQLLHAGLALRTAGYKTFQKGKGPLAIVMQGRTGSMGIDLSATDTMVFWTPPTSLLHWDQVSARIRKYKDMRTLAYYYLITKGTIEEAKYLALQQNIELAKLVGDHPELISYQEAG
jgi:hypothetical protein